PEAAQAILAHGPQLLDTFISGKRLLARAAAVTPAGAEWLVALQDELARQCRAPEALEKTALFGQFSNVLHVLAQRRPLLITLDDLQWIDEASGGLLFHLGRQLAGSRILIIGAFWPDELEAEHNGEAHPLRQIVDELQRRFGEIFIDLAQADRNSGRAFIDALVDTEANRLDGTFRQALFQQTGGHPLFVVELLREMQSRGTLVQDSSGRWVAADELDWETLPARVEAVIARRVDRLEPKLREILDVASVAGERFHPEVIAQVLRFDERDVLRTLSQELQRQHRLVR